MISTIFHRFRHMAVGLGFLSFALALIIGPVRAQTNSDTPVRIQELERTVERLRVELADREERIAELEESGKLDRPVYPTVKRLRKTISRLKKTIQNQRQQLRETENLTAEQKQQLREQRRDRNEKMQELQEKLRNVKQAKTDRQGGEMSITLESSILFPFGEARLKESAKQTLERVLEHLEGYENYRILVEGHTDTVPIKSQPFKSNWALSAHRAVNVVEFLDKESDIAGDRLVAAGLGEYHPVAPNTSMENRAKNRRVEIRLVPIENLKAGQQIEPSSNSGSKDQ